MGAQDDKNLKKKRCRLSKNSGSGGFQCWAAKGATEGIENARFSLNTMHPVSPSLEQGRRPLVPYPFSTPFILAEPSVQVERLQYSQFVPEMADSYFSLNIAALATSGLAIVLSYTTLYSNLITSTVGIVRKIRPGHWDNSVVQSFNFQELKFEVEVNVPVIFCTHKGGFRNPPLSDQDIVHISDTDDRYREAGFQTLAEVNDRFRRAVEQQSVRNTELKMATWVELLSELQRMERESSQWQDRQFDSGRSNPVDSGRTLRISFQRKHTLLKDQPIGVDGVCARTTLGDLCLITMALGMTWIEFDQSWHRYRCEGNGLGLTGVKITGSNLLFTFFQSHLPSFQKNRVIPANQARELCFGYVPTIFRTLEDFEGGLLTAADAERLPDTLHTLQLSSPRSIADTLAQIGCNMQTQKCFISSRANTDHLFPVAFELIGMLAQPIHIMGTSFRRVPNPTTYYWRPRSFDLTCLMASLRRHLDTPGPITPTPQLSEVCRSINAIEGEYDAEPAGCSYKLLDELHDAIDHIDDYLTKSVSQLDVLQIVRRHFEIVLEQLNNTESEFEKLAVAPPLKRESLLADLYFSIVRSAVVGAGVKPNGTQATTLASEGARRQAPRLGDERLALGIEDKKNNIWCLLMFRMVFWLMLHDFHRSDVQKLGPGCLGCQIAVFIE
ncbi:modin [Fusarium albosuccineum]|uniref:Modin n=1 Tax=Fusarium albosuccineum TaxID=1237068 RepID=A0A8H4P890_9HYPO|nr:modin [Fusarium albosuccineum]